MHLDLNSLGLNSIDPKIIIGAVIVLVIALVAIALAVHQRRKKTAKLRSHFGSEYDRAVLAHGSRQKAESQLAELETRVKDLKLRDLTIAEHDKFLAEWQAAQARFVDFPRSAVTEADELVANLMVARGYPVSNFDRRAADISVNHPRLVQNYRFAHAVVVRPAGADATTEELRAAMLHFRTLFDELLIAQTAGEVRAA
jgi:hypothetical protein